MTTDNTAFVDNARLSAKSAIACWLIANSLLMFAQNVPSVQEDITLGVPRLVSFNGVLKDAAGKPRIGIAGVRLAIYNEENGGAPLWQETQNVQLDSQGRYFVLLGASANGGVPPELFTSGEPRWLGVQALFPGEQEQPRVLLVSVPYALKAGDADTLGGLPATAFLRAPQGGPAVASSPASDAAAVPTGAEIDVTDLPSGLGYGAPRRSPPAVNPPYRSATTSHICYANDYSGADIFARFNSAMAACGHGEIRIRQGTYGNVNTTANLTQPADSMVCEGSVTINYTGTGDAINWRMTPFTIAPAGRIEGCQIVGTASGLSGIHMGDIVGWTLDRFVVSGFTRSGASGIWWDNYFGWLERGTVSPSVAANNNTIGLRMTNSGGTGLTDSFCYDRVLGLALQVNQNQIGISTESGKFCHGTMITTINSLGANKTLISLSGPGLWQDGFYQITTEDDGGGGTRLSIGPSAGITGMGMFDHYGTSAPMSDSILGGLYLYFPHLNAVGMWYADQNSNIGIQAFPGATSSNNVSAPFIQMKGEYWNGTATSSDSLIVQEVLGTGTNPSSTYTISHSGSTGPFGLFLNDGTGHGTYLSASGDLAGTIEILHGTENNHTFAKVFNSSPVCTITPTSNPLRGSTYWVTSSPASLTAHVSPQQVISFNYHCIGQTD